MTVSFLNWGVHGWRPSYLLRRTLTTVEPLRVSPPEAVAYQFELGVSRQVVIPKKLHDRLGLKPGDYLEIEEQQGRVVMTPKTLIDSRVHAAFRESMEDFKSGRYSGPFDTAEQATASFHKIAGARRARQASRR